MSWLMNLCARYAIDALLLVHGAWRWQRSALVLDEINGMWEPEVAALCSNCAVAQL